MSITRRNLLAIGAVLAGRKAFAQHPGPSPSPSPGPSPGPSPSPRGLVVPNGSLLPSKVVGGVRVFHLRAEPIRHEIAPGLTIDTWGYNGATPGPVLEAVEG